MSAAAGLALTWLVPSPGLARRIGQTEALVHHIANADLQAEIKTLNRPDLKQHAGPLFLALPREARIDARLGRSRQP